MTIANCPSVQVEKSEALSALLSGKVIADEKGMIRPIGRNAFRVIPSGLVNSFVVSSASVALYHLANLN